MKSQKKIPKFVLIFWNDDWFGKDQPRILVFPCRVHLKVGEKIKFGTYNTSAKITLPLSIFTNEIKTTIVLDENQTSKLYTVKMPNIFKEKAIKNFEFSYMVEVNKEFAKGCSPPSMIIEDEG